MFTKDQLDELLALVDGGEKVSPGARAMILTMRTAHGTSAYAGPVRPECLCFADSESVMVRMSYAEVEEFRAVREEICATNWVDLPLPWRIHERIKRNMERLQRVGNALDHRLSDGGFFG